MRGWVSSLCDRVAALVVLGFVLGLITMWTWRQSELEWRLYQNQSYYSGQAIYNTLVHRNDPPKGVTIYPLDAADTDHANAGEFQRISSAPPNARITIVPISRPVDNLAQRSLTATHLRFVALSSDITYPTTELHTGTKNDAAGSTAALTKLLSSYCSNPLVIAQLEDRSWKRVEGSSVWDCESAPADHRLLSVLFTMLSLAILTTLALNSTREFDLFTKLLRRRENLASNSLFKTQGPRELQEIISALNNYLNSESITLEKRAAVLAGVSHDLGTPSTRLKLRAALIEDADLREKLEHDIDSMTAMIDSVLTYTRTELNSEAPRRLFLNTLVESVVFNYQDTGHPVSYKQTADVIVKTGSSLFTSVQGHGKIKGDRNIVVAGQPVALERAINNLIDNALKYGKSAKLSIEPSADTVDICVDDEGMRFYASQSGTLRQPYERGNNTEYISGQGLGLTIVDAIARQHGGTLLFEDKQIGTRARLRIQRGN